MLTVLPLLIVALTATPAITASAASFTTSEKRTLHSAVSSALHSAAINHYYQQCKEPSTEGEVKLALTDKDQARMLTLLQQKVHSQDIDLLLATDARLAQQIKKQLSATTDCNNAKAFQTLLDNYEVALFSLEIAMPLEKPLHSATAVAKSRANARQNEVNQLIASSHAIALVTVTDKQQLTALQQANYFHPDYQGRYVFKVQHGWRSNIAQYLGMHIFVADTDISKTAKQWLIFLDKNGHFIKAIAAAESTAYLTALSDAEWRYDVHGNLHRN